MRPKKGRTAVSGLGLSIVRNLAEMHGGSVSAESEGEGRGARFTVTLPILAASGVTASLWASQDGTPEFHVFGQARDEKTPKNSTWI
jgi:hypothetical protein